MKPVQKRVIFIASLTVLLVLALSATAAFAAWPGSGSVFQQADPDAGLVIVRVDTEGPAAAAGVVRGDILLAVDGEEVNRVTDLTQALQGLEAGDRLRLTVLHGDDVRQLTAVLDEQDGRTYLGLAPYEEPTLSFGRMAVQALQPGALVVEVAEDSPAAAAGLEPGNLITAVDDQNLSADTDLADVLAEYEPGDTITLEVQRLGEDESAEIEVTLGEHPDRTNAPYLGIQYRSMNLRGLPLQGLENLDDLQGMLEDLPLDEMPHRGFFRNFPFQTPEGMEELMTEGAVIMQVTEDGPAAEAGLQAGEIITALDGEPVAAPSDIADALAELQPGETVTLTVQPASGEEGDTPSEVREVEVVLGEHPDDAERAYLGVALGGHMMRFRGTPIAPDGDSPARPFFRWMQPQDDNRNSLPFGLELPFDLEQLPFDLQDLQDMFQFELPQVQPAPDQLGESI